MHAAQKTATTVTQELLRLLMLQSCSPEMMAPGQIEAADWEIEQLGGDFTLRPRGVADNPFCFDPASDSPPRRAAGQPPDPDGGLRYFGAGLGYDALERAYKQMTTTKSAEIKGIGKEIAPHVQLSAVQHLLAFWRDAPPYTPPARSPATGTLRVIHGYAEAWQHLSRVRSATTELTLAEDGDVPEQAPETWTLRDTGGNELGVEIPHRSGDWVHCGDVVAVSTGGNDERSLGIIRSMHAEPGLDLHANIHIMSRNPKALQLRAVIAKDEENAFSEESARQFAFHSVRAIILSDGSDASQPANLLLPPDSWKEGRVFEATLEGAARYLRVVRPLRRGDDYVRATFEWTEKA
jgi:ribosome modulation factor